jgi:hypothetical protein
MRTIRRMAMVLGAVTGLLVLFGNAAHALIAANHCEPLRRR